MYFHIHMILDVFVIILANFQKIFSAKLGQEIRELTRSDLSETGQRWGARARGGLEPGVSTISGPARRRKTTTCAVADSTARLKITAIWRYHELFQDLDTAKPSFKHHFPAFFYQR